LNGSFPAGVARNFIAAPVEANAPQAPRDPNDHGVPVASGFLIARPATAGEKVEEYHAAVDAILGTIPVGEGAGKVSIRQVDQIRQALYEVPEAKRRGTLTMASEIRDIVLAGGKDASGTTNLILEQMAGQGSSNTARSDMYELMKASDAKQGIARSINFNHRVAAQMMKNFFLANGITKVKVFRNVGGKLVEVEVNVSELSVERNYGDLLKAFRKEVADEKKVDDLLLAAGKKTNAWVAMDEAARKQLEDLGKVENRNLFEQFVKEEDLTKIAALKDHLNGNRDLLKELVCALPCKNSRAIAGMAAGDANTCK